MKANLAICPLNTPLIINGRFLSSSACRPAASVQNTNDEIKSS